MADTTPSPEDMARQARQRLESLKAEGIEWLPKPPKGAARRRKMASDPSASIQNQEPSLFQPTAPPPIVPLHPERRLQELSVLSDRVRTCTRCSELVASRTQTVFGVGRVDPDVAFIGEAPGADEDRQGEPFVGAAGQLLDKILAACGFRREEVYIMNILKCRPPGNRTPRLEEATSCREYLDAQIKLVRPKFIVALGGTAAQNLLGTTVPLGKLRGRFHDHQGIPVLCTYHPAYLLPHRAPEKKKEVWEDMKFLLQKMGRPIPPPNPKA